MELIIDFYKSLDTLNLIIFWGIIIVIILLLIFSFILMNKNKKLKSIVENNAKTEEEIPVKKEENIISESTLEETSLPLISKEETEPILENNSKIIETEKTFIAEEHVMEYSKDLFSLSNIKKTTNNEEKIIENQQKQSIKMPTGPYQRNVLREMSLSQTSPIGINRQETKIDKKIEIAKDLEESLNNAQIETPIEEEILDKKSNNIKEIDNQIKKELGRIKEEDNRKTEIKLGSNLIKNVEEFDSEKKDHNYITKLKDNTEIQTKELLNNEPELIKENQNKSSSEKYLEEVSRKLAEAEIPKDIERTNYELKQEEDAIISYKELMEKKDSIQTIDEEEAVISIEELMNRNNQKQEITREETKLYNLSEEEENDNFIKELKQFRNDL